MKRLQISGLLPVLTLLLLLFAAPAQAIEFTVSSSSEFMGFFGSFGPENLLDGDPATAWAEGVEGRGEGEWVLFEFGRELVVERMGVRNGWQRPGEFEANNRPAAVRLIFSDQTELVVPLDESEPWQMFEVDKRTASVRMVIESVRPGASMLKYNRTCVSDVSFELALPAGSAALAETMIALDEPETSLPKTPVAADAAEPQATLQHVEDPAEQVAAAPDVEAAPVTQETASDNKKIGISDIFGTSEGMPVLPAVDVEAMSSAPVPRASNTPGEIAVDDETVSAVPAKPAAEAKKRFSLSDIFGSADGGPTLRPVDTQAMGGTVASGSPAAQTAQAGYGEPTTSVSESAATPAAPDAAPEVVVESSGAPTSPALAADEAPAAEREGLEELPEVDMKAMAGERETKGGKVAGIQDQEAVRVVIREYFTKLVTLDDEYVALYAENVRDNEAFMFEYFKELQRQRHVFHLFREALVDTKNLRFGPALLEHGRIKLEVDGHCTLYVADTYEDMPVHTMFSFVKENDVWRIAAAEDLEVEAN